MSRLRAPGGIAVVLGVACVLAAAADTKPSWSEAMVSAREVFLRSPEGRLASSRDSLFEPFDSGPLDGKGPAKPVVVNVSGLRELRLVAICERHPANCNIWGEPKLIARDGTVTRLTALEPTSVHVGWGELLLDKNWQGHPLTVGDRTFAFGIWVHADSDVRFALDGKYERFEAFVGEDRDRADGLVRFRVLSTPPALPSAWADLSRVYALQAGWLRADVGLDGIGAWFGPRETVSLEREMIGAILRGVPVGSPLRGELDGLVAAQTPVGQARWLDLFARACRYRDCAVLAQPLLDAAERAEFEKELANLAATRVPVEDERWERLRSRLVHAAELDEQFLTLQHDMRQHAALCKAGGQRNWNGTSYAPAEGSVAAEIAGQAFHRSALIVEGDRDPADIVLRRSKALLDDLRRRLDGDWGPFEARLAELANAVADTPVADVEARRSLHHEICRLRRRIACRNPLLDFRDIVFIKRHRAFYEHMCDQFYGLCQNPGGGLYVLEDAFGPAPRVRDILAGSVCETGRLRGRRLAGGNVRPPGLRYDGVRTISGEDAEGGSFLSPALSPDGRRLVFAYVEREGGREQIFHEDPTRGHWDVQRCYHLFAVNLDGTGLRQLTDGTWNDFDPCWLPNGRIAFISERRGGYLRCGRACPLYTLYDMAPDGSGINCLSFHDSNEWNPSVSHDGRIVWTRWDYVDRHGCVAHMPWTTTLDGSDPRPLHGNYAPRQARADMELCVRAIPGSRKYVGLAAPHHGQAYGSIIVIDPSIPDDDGMGPVRRFTPEVGFPESQGGRQVYSTPWPLSEEVHLCVYDAAMSGAPIRRGAGNYGIYLVDAFGNRELLYRDPDIACMHPIPLLPRALPGGAASPLAEASSRSVVGIGDEGEATMAVVNVYDYQVGWPEGTKIQALRILQLLPCAVPSGGLRPHETGRRIAEAGDSMMPCRWVVGTVPVEADGSAHFTVPAYRQLFFQALDGRGMAITSMRSATYARDGERVLCLGCHENKSHALGTSSSLPLAVRRPPSRPTPDVEGSRPFSYPRLVQPVLDRNCVPCHRKDSSAKAPNLGREPIAQKFYASYNALVPYGFTRYGDSYRTRPGAFGARASKLIAMLDRGHHGVDLSEEDVHRLVLWLDCCSMFYGVFEREPGEAQLRGEVADSILK
ncbi:MAG: NPCBM/NEW2 domain-containing protein [Lentisphaeria bacterium]|nr:NPCBM/NEW2 domain-containing protein [Lentisphaeria bacterium]